MDLRVWVENTHSVILAWPESINSTQVLYTPDPGQSHDDPNA